MTDATDLLQAGRLRLGFGCAGAWAKPWHSERAARGVFHAALDAGVRHFDTAGFYAGGEGERRLGRMLKDFGEPIFVSTKTGTRYRARGAALKDFSAAAIRADVEASLSRLGRDRLDLVYLHGPDADGLKSGIEALARLKAEGKIGLAGVCAEGAELDCAVAADGTDVVMAVYNLFQRGHAPAFARARKKGLRVVAIAPLGQALYRRDMLRLSPVGLWTAARAVLNNRDVLAAARTARAALESVEGWTPVQLALAFALASPDVDLAVTSTTRQVHLAEILAAARRPLPATALRAVERIGLDRRGGGA